MKKLALLFALFGVACAPKQQQDEPLQDSVLTEAEIIQAESIEPPSTISYKVKDLQVLFENEKEPGSDLFTKVSITKGDESLVSLEAKSNGYSGSNPNVIFFYDEPEATLIIIVEDDEMPKKLITAFRYQNGTLFRVGELGPISIESITDIDGDKRIELTGVDQGSPDNTDISNLSIYEFTSEIKLDEVVQKQLRKK